MRQQPNLGVGDLVLTADKNTPRGDKNTPRGRCPKALVEQTFPDSEGIVRQVVVRTADEVYNRDVRKLRMLEEKLLAELHQKTNETGVSCTRAAMCSKIPVMNSSVMQFTRQTLRSIEHCFET